MRRNFVVTTSFTTSSRAATSTVSAMTAYLTQQLYQYTERINYKETDVHTVDISLQLPTEHATRPVV